jgi:hypothetical protein
VIRVVPQPEPDDFDRLVRAPGQRALANGQSPLPAYWRRCLPDLLAGYGRICAYTCLYIERVTGAWTVDHYQPKALADVGVEDDGRSEELVRRSADPALVYEWGNYRLACSLMNSRKGACRDVLDPFEVQKGWFGLDLVSFAPYPCADLGPACRDAVAATIRRLGLDDEECCRARREYAEAYLDGSVSFEYLRRKCPFVAIEMERQGWRRTDD